MTKLIVSLKPQTSGKTFVYNYCECSLKLVFRKPLKRNETYSIQLYNSQLMLLFHAKTDDVHAEREGKTLKLDSHDKQIWLPGMYFLLLRDADGNVTRYDLQLDEEGTFHTKAPLLCPKMSDEDMISGRVFEKKAHWWLLSNKPGAGQLKRWVIERAKQNELNALREDKQEGGLALQNNLLISSKTPSIIGPAITLMMHAGEVKSERRFANLNLFYDTTKNNFYEEMNDFFAETEPSSDFFSMIEASTKAYTYVYSGLNALFDTGGKVIMKTIQAHWSGSKDSVIFIGTPQETANLLEQTPSLKEQFPMENRLAMEPLTREEMIHTFFNKVKQVHLSLSAEAVDKVCRLITKAYELGLAGNWDRFFLRGYVEKSLVPTYQKHAIEQVRKGGNSFLQLEVQPCDIDDAIFLRKSSPYDEAIEALQSMVGLTEIKRNICMLSQQMRFFQERRQMGLRTKNDATYHTILTGNPGTGKTTVAKLLGRIYHSLGLLSKGNVVYADRSTIVGRYIGETEENMKQLLKEAQGNVLFIDEAYTLYTQGDERDFGRHAVESLLDVLARKDPDMLIIFAGYEKEMDALMSMNPGLLGRFPYKFHFPNYTAEELMQIAEKLLSADQYELTPEASDLLLLTIRNAVSIRHNRFSNARWVEQFVKNGIIPAIANRVTASPHAIGRLAYQRIEADDVRTAAEKFSQKTIELKHRNSIGFCA